MSQKFSLFPDDRSVSAGLGMVEIPEHTRAALDDYFLRGYQPGNFLTSVLTNNLYGAVGSADFNNRHAIYEITKWLIHNDGTIPHNSFGTTEKVTDWLRDTNSIRTNFVEKFEKEYIWKTLKA